MDESGAFAFTLLGAVRGWRGAEELALAGPQQRAALAMLLLAQGQPVSKEELVDGLWGADCPRAGATTVRTYVSRLRTLLEPGHRAAGGPSVLVSVESSYALRLPETCLDVTLAERETASATAARRAGDVRGARLLLGRAVARHRGTPLTGLTGPFADTWRERLVQGFLGALETRVELDLELGDATPALADLTAAVGEHPLRESLRMLLMRALYQCGRQAEALEVFAETRALLAAELGIDPDPRLCRLYERILRSDPELLPYSAPEPEPSPIPVRGEPARTAATLAPAQLPADIADFTGREQLVADLTERLSAPAGPAVRICAVSGIGGTGKTALAVHVAHRLRSRFPAGQLFVDLAGVTDHPALPHTVLGQLLHALGVPEAGVPEDVDERAALYRTMLADQRMLVVLNNAANAGQIRRLLPGYPGCAVIVTSRARLTAVPAHTVDLDPFRPAEALELLGAVIGPERVAAEAPDARELVAACGHLPLAVRIIAGRITARPGATVADCLRRLSDERRRLDQLRTGDLDVRACFQLGYDQLAPEPARAFRLLALPDAETISLPFAAALLQTDEYDAEEVLDELLHTGLLQSPQLGRYRYHDLLRLFARRLCADTDPEEQVAAALSHLLGFLLSTAQGAYRAVRPGHRMPELLDGPPGPCVAFPDARAAHDWFEQERECILKTVEQAVRRAPSLVGPAADVLLGLDPLLERCYAWPDIVELGGAVAAAAEAAGLPHAEAAARYMLGGALWQLSRSAEATGHIERAARLCREHDDPLVLAEVLNLRALIAASGTGHTPDTVRMLREAREFQRAIGNPSGEANSLGSLTFALTALGEAADAVEAGAAGLALYRELGDPMGEAPLLINRGAALRLSGDAEAAMSCYAQGLELTRALGLRYMEAVVLHRIAETHLLRSDAPAAVEAAEEAGALSREIGLVQIEARALATLGEALAALGRHDRATARLRSSVALYRRLGLLGEGDRVARSLAALTEAAAAPGPSARPGEPPAGEPPFPAPPAG